MNNIPIPIITGVTDAEKIQNIISYLSQLFTELDRVLSSIGFPNLSHELSESIRKGITEHQDLSAYATRKFALDEDNITYGQAQSYVHSYTQSLLANYVTESDFNDLSETVNDLSGSVSSHSTSIATIEEALNGDGYFNKGILYRLQEIEDQLGI